MMSDSLPNPETLAGEEAEIALRAARVCKMRKDHWGAFSEAQRACSLAPMSVSAHEYASECAKDVGQWEEAVAYLDRVAALVQANTEGSDSQSLPEIEARLERLRKDAEAFSRPTGELVSEAKAGVGSWKMVFKSVFLRPDPLWYRSGWFHLILALCGVVLFVLLLNWFLSAGPWLFLFGAIEVGMAAWVAYDAHLHGEPALFWGPVALFGSLFGFALYLTVRGMSSGIGEHRGGRFFSG